MKNSKNAALSIMQDANTQKDRAEKALLDLEESEEKYRRLITEINDGFFIIDIQGIYTFVNPALARIFGIDDPEEFIGKSFLDFINPDMRNKLWKNYEKGIKTGIMSKEIEVPILNNSGSTKHILIKPVLITENNEIIGIRGIISDITERKETMEQLQKFSMAVEGSPASIVITNTKGIIEYVNGKFTEVTGYTSEEAISSSLGILNSGRLPKEFFKNLWDTILAGKEWKGEFCNKKKNGEIFWESASISPIRNDKNKITHFVAIKEDVTERKKIAEELELAKEAAEIANQTKSEFLANMSHEIRTPMNAVIGFSDLLSAKITDQKLSSYVDSIKSSGKSLLTLINDILDLSKIEAGKLSLQKDFINIKSLIDEVKNIFSLKIKEKALDMIIVIEPNLPSLLFLDEVRLRQILINLIGNAIKFTEKGFIKINLYSKNEISKNNNTIELFIEIEDSGIGIIKDNHEKIFETFTQQDQQSTKKYGGTGLGLPISRKLVELMNGSLTLISENGKGCTFIINLNAVKYSLMGDTGSGSLNNNLIDPKNIFFKKSKVLIIDDIENNLLYLSGALELASLDIIEAINGKEGLKKAHECKPDLIITDIKMPVMTGFELIKAIRKTKELKKTPVIAMSASVMIDSQLKIKEHDFDAFLMKPVQLDLLFNELIKYLPHSILKESDSNELSELTSINSNDLPDNIEDIYHQLSNEIKELWKELQEQQPMDKVEIFAAEINKIGELNKIEALIQYAKNLNTSIINFDVYKMLNTLKQFPDLLKQFKNVIALKK